MTSRVDCHVLYDPEADVALLSFADPLSGSGGSALEFDDESGLAGLLRLGTEGQFDHLELLGAKGVVLQLIADLRAPAPGTRDYYRGVVNVRVTTTEHGAIRFHLVETAVSSAEYEVAVQTEPPSLTHAVLRYDGKTKVLRSLTLFPSGNLLGSMAGLTSN